MNDLDIRLPHKLVARAGGIAWTAIVFSIFALMTATPTIVALIAKLFWML